MEKITAAIIGYGGMGMGHHGIMKFQFPDEIEVKGCFDIDEGRCALARKYDIITYSSRQELLEDEDIDFVVVATPNDVHKEIVIDALEHGKHVICEKPVALSVDELKEMIEAANRNNRIFTVHQNRRWDPDYLLVKQIVEDNTVSDVFNIESRVHGSRGVPGDWRNIKKYGGGMILDWGIHLFDQVLHFFEDAKIVSVYAQTSMITTDDVDDNFKVEFKLDNGVDYHVEVGTSNFVSLPRWYVQGKNGTAVIEDWENNGKVVMVEDWENKDAEPIRAGVGLTKTMAPRTDDSIKEFPLPELKKEYRFKRSVLHENLIKAIKGEETQLVTHEQQIRLMKLIEAIFESAENNKVVYFE